MWAGIQTRTARLSAYIYLHSVFDVMGERMGVWLALVCAGARGRDEFDIARNEGVWNTDRACHMKL